MKTKARFVVPRNGHATAAILRKSGPQQKTGKALRRSLKMIFIRKIAQGIREDLPSCRYAAPTIFSRGELSSTKIRHASPEGSGRRAPDAGVAQLVEHLPSKQNVVGSRPIARSRLRGGHHGRPSTPWSWNRNSVVECWTVYPEAAGSTPVGSAMVWKGDRAR